MDATIVLVDALDPALRDIYLSQVPEGFRFLHHAAGEPCHPLEEADYVFVVVEPLTEAVIRRMRRARLIHMVGVGYDHIDLAAAARMRIPVCTAAGANAAAVAEHALLLMLALQRKLMPIAQATAQGAWPRFQYRSECFELYGKRVGIVGLGTIGKQVAMRLRAFGCEVRYYDIVRPTPAQELALGVAFAPFKELLAWADIVTLHVPLTTETHHLMNEETLALMRPNALLINTARGPVVDAAALARALRAGRLRGAGLDVHEVEPIPPDYPLYGLQDVILTPHVAAGTRDSQTRVVKAAFDNVVRVANGERPINQVNAWVDAEAGGVG